MSQFSKLQKKRNAQRTAFGIPESAWGGELGDEVGFIPTETLLQAYRNQRNPFNLDEAVHPAALRSMLAELQKRGIKAGDTKQTGGISGSTRHLGKTVIGPALKKLAPAAMLIPGIGPLASGAIAAGAHLGGQALTGEKIDPLQSLLVGAGTGAADAAVGAAGGLKNVATKAAKGAKKLGGKALAGIAKDPLRAAQIALIAQQAYQGQKRQDQSRALVDRALQSLPMGTGMPTPISLDEEFRDPSNPFTRPSSAPRRGALQAANTALGGGY